MRAVFFSPFLVFVSFFLPFRVVMSLCRCKETVSVVHFLIFTCGLTEIHHKSGSTVFITSSLIRLPLSLSLYIFLSLSEYFVCLPKAVNICFLCQYTHTTPSLAEGMIHIAESSPHTHTQSDLHTMKR